MAVNATLVRQDAEALYKSEAIHRALHGARDMGVTSLGKVTDGASVFLSDLKSVNFHQEVFPVDKHLISHIAADPYFWTVACLAAVPLLINTLEKQEFQLTAFALFFAAIWGVIFKTLIVRTEAAWKYLAASLFFTGVVGIPSLLVSYDKVLPKAYLTMSASDSGVTSLLGYILQVGLCEEFVKIIPVLAYLFFKKKAANPLTAILIGIFSGLGFAAFENMRYGDSSVLQSIKLAKKAGAAGVAFGTHAAMVNVMVRSLSLVFCHATFTGIFSYFVITGFATGKRFLALLTVGLAVSSVLHGVYDWLTGVQTTMATAVVVLAFVLFYSYLTKLKALLESPPPTDA